MYVYIRTHEHTNFCIYHVYIYKCIGYVYIKMYMYVYISTHEYRDFYMYKVYIYKCIWEYGYVCIKIYVYVYINICTHEYTNFYMYTCICAYITISNVQKVCICVQIFSKNSDSLSESQTCLYLYIYGGIFFTAFLYVHVYVCICQDSYMWIYAGTWIINENAFIYIQILISQTFSCTCIYLHM